MLEHIASIPLLRNYCFCHSKEKQYFLEKIRLTSLSMIVIKRNFCLGTPPTERLERDVLSGIVRPRVGAFWSSGLKRWRPVRTEIDKTTKGSRIRDQDTQADRRASERASDEWVSDRQRDRQSDREASKQADRHRDRQKDRETGRQAGR